MPSTYSEFTEYHMKCINRFRYSALTRSVIFENGAGSYVVKPSPILAQIIFYFYVFNTFTKLVFLAFLITDHLGPIDFLDRIGGMDYFLCGTMVCLAYVIWQRYPLYEIIYRLWEIENRIYRRLGRPQYIKWEAEEKHSVTIWAHLILASLGFCSVALQFYEAPKYCVYTYSLFTADNSFLRAIFCFHEVLFLSHAWAAMACSNGLCTFEAVNLSLLINQMSKAVDELAQNQSVPEVGFSPKNRTNDSNGTINLVEGNDNGNEVYDENGRVAAFSYNDGKTYAGNTESVITSDVDAKGSGKHRKSLRNSGKVGLGSETYTFKRILYDYQQLMLASEMFNAWIGYKIVALSIIAFCQYISSTTMAFQVLRMPGTGVGDIWFYIQDCVVAVYVTFRVFDFMSIVLPASEQFLNSVRNYMAMKVIVGGHTRKFQKTLKPVSLKLGPNPLRREAVLETMEMLASYYVCVALW